MLRKSFYYLRVTISAIFIFFLGVGIYFAQRVPNPASANINWDQRVDKLLKVSKKGDIILTAVGDMIFNREISHFTERRKLPCLICLPQLLFHNFTLCSDRSIRRTGLCLER